MDEGGVSADCMYVCVFVLGFPFLPLVCHTVGLWVKEFGLKKKETSKAVATSAV